MRYSKFASYNESRRSEKRYDINVDTTRVNAFKLMNIA